MRRSLKTLIAAALLFAGVAADSATPAPSAVLTWTAPTQSVGGGPVTVLGYRLYRRCDAGAIGQTGGNLPATPLTYTDTPNIPPTAIQCWWSISAFDATGESVRSNEVSKVFASPDTVPPSTAPSNLVATAQSSSQINLTWGAATDNVGVTGYNLERCQGAGCTTFSQFGSAVGLSQLATGLNASTTYRFRARAFDLQGNLGPYSNIANGTTQGAPDTTAPTIPGNLAASVLSSSSIRLTWEASTDASGIAGYALERCAGSACSNFAIIGSQTVGTTADVVGLTGATLYRFRIRAFDASPAANNSAYSNIAQATTTGVADTTPPSVPPNFVATAVSSVQINLSWGASTDAVGVTGYNVWRCSAPPGCAAWVDMGTFNQLTLVDAGRAASTSYRYRIRARDAAANFSSFFVSPTITTPAPPTVAPPAAPVLNGITTTLHIAGVDNVTTGLDSFNRANETPVGAPWATRRGSGMSLSSNALLNPNSSDNSSVYDGDVIGPDQESWATVSGMSASAHYVAVNCRMVDADNYWEFGTDGTTGTDHTYFGRWVGGVWNEVTAIATTVANGDRIKLRCTGQTPNIVLTAFKDTGAGWVQIAQSTGNSGSNSGNPGAGGFGTAAVLDNWGGSDTYAVQADSIGFASGSFSTVALTIDPVGDDNLIAGVVTCAGGASLTSVTDDQSNVYDIVDFVDDSAGNNQKHYSFYGKNLQGGPTVITANFSTPIDYRGMSLVEFHGLDTVDPLDDSQARNQANPGTGTDGASSGAGTQTPSVDGSIVYGGSVNGGSAGTAGVDFVAGTGFTIPAGASFEPATGEMTLSSEYQQQATATAVNASFTVSQDQDHGTFQMIFKPADGAPPGPADTIVFLASPLRF